MAADGRDKILPRADTAEATVEGFEALFLWVEGHMGRIGNHPAIFKPVAPAFAGDTLLWQSTGRKIKLIP